MNARRLLRGAVASTMAMAIAILVPAPSRADEMRAGEFSPPRDAPDFTLDGSDGHELVLSGHRGRIVLLGFGFTSCPAICPTTLATLARARKELGPDAADVDVVYVTVDPEKDTVERLRTFLAGFDPAFVGGTGPADKLAAVRQSYGVQTEKLGDGYVHSSSVYLIDREGKLRALMPYGHPSEDYVHDARILLGR